MQPPTPSFPIERLTLDNDLRVVVAPDRSAPIAAVAVYYDVGFRSEPEGRTGFAHLFEHMMFQGSANVDKMEHVNLIQGSGGSLNGTTTADYTNYFEAVPAGALELTLFLEADRMRSLRLTQENLDNQIAVVKEEVRVNVLNQPYGGFPWIQLPAVMFDTFANAHNGYGSFEDLEAATLEDVTDFFHKYYAPGNALVAIVGDVDVDDAAVMTERHFGPIEARPVPRRPSFAEPLPTTPRRATHHDPHAPTPAAALGYRIPDPGAAAPEVAALAVLVELLTSGEAAALHRRLVRDDELATSVTGWVGVFGGGALPNEYDPTRLQFLVHYPDAANLDAILAAVDEELATLTAGVDEGELAAVVAEMTGAYLSSVDSFLARALTIAPMELQRGRAELAAELPTQLAAITPRQVAAAAAEWLRPERRTVLELVPGGPL